MTPMQVLEIAQTITDLYEQMEYRLMDNIINQVMLDKTIDDNSKWRLYKLSQLGKLNDSNLAIMKESLTDMEKEIEIAIMESVGITLDEIEPGYETIVKNGLVDAALTPTQSPKMKKVIAQYTKQITDSLNITNTVMLKGSLNAYKKLVMDSTKLANKIIGVNALEVVTGIESRQDAMLRTIKEFNDNGITAFVDKLGRNWNPEGYVNMVIRTNVSNTANSTIMARAEDHGIDLIETSSHAGSRPLCSIDQGRIFSRSGKSKKYPKWSSSSYGKPNGILGINCGHSIYPYVEGVSIQRYFPVSQGENDPLYVKLQEQRRLERNLRKTKRLQDLQSKTGNDTKKINESIKMQNKNIAIYCKKNGLTRRINREVIQ